MIFLDTNVISEPLRKQPDQSVVRWIGQHEPELALPVAAIAEIAFGISKVRPDHRADRLADGLERIRKRFDGRIYLFTEEAALVYGEVMGNASRRGRPMASVGGIIAAIALVNGGRLATRNLRDFETTGLELISPWDHGA